MRVSSLFLGLLLVAAPASWAIGTVTDGDASFSYSTSFDNSTCSERVTFVPGTVGGAPDVAWQIWWWLGVDGAHEEQLPPPTTETYVGAVATLGFTALGGLPGLDATLVGTVRDGAGDNQASWLEQLTISNQSGASVTLDLLHYADIEVGGTFANDTATLDGPGFIRIVDQVVPGVFEEYRALAPTAFQVNTYRGLCDSLNDLNPTDLADSGLPFGPGDFTGAWEWRSVTLEQGESRIFATAVGIDVPVLPGGIFEDGFESGDTGAWSSTVSAP